MSTWAPHAYSLAGSLLWVWGELITFGVGAVQVRRSHLDLVASYGGDQPGHRGWRSGACGLLVALRRPTMPIGWLFLVGSLAPVDHRRDHARGRSTVAARTGPRAPWRSLTTVYLLAWPWGILFAIPNGVLCCSRLGIS